MQELLTQLGRAVDSNPLVALPAALVWGVLSILLSPCHLSSIPLIIGFMTKDTRQSCRSALRVTTAFAVGILLTIAVVGMVTAGLGRMLGDVGSINYLVAGILIIVGLYLLDAISLSWSGPMTKMTPKRGMFAAFVLGLVFGTAVGPCTFAYMAPILAVVFKTASTRFLYAASLLFAFGVGHCSIIVIAGASAQLVQKYLNWNETSRGALILKRVCGGLVILGAIHLIWTA